jgi:o-succinylbenzoate---CoA ligase
MNVAPLARLARQPASAPALAWPGGQMSCGELSARLDALARAAAGLGAPDSPLAILCASRLNLVVGVLAALRLGRPALPLDPARPGLQAILAACAPGGTLTDELVASTATAAGSTDPPAPSAAGGALTDGARSGEPALLVPTSGTSGAARVAMLTAASLDEHVAASAAVLPPLGPGDRWLVCLPMTSIGGLAALWRALSAGACLGLVERFHAGDARGLMAEGASHVSVVPAMLAPLAGQHAPSPRGLRCLLSGGGPLTAAAADAALAQGWPLWTGWGMTETASHVAAGPVNGDWREGVVGRPLPGARIDIDAATGRLAVGGAMVMSGYATPGMEPGLGLAPDGSFLSSDLGEFLPDGRLRVTGRADDVIVTGGVNVHPETVEAVLSACPGAGEVAVTARSDERWGLRLVALFTGEIAPAALDAWARERLPSGSRPREFLHVERLPRNAMGKLLRSRLQALLPPTR